MAMSKASLKARIITEMDAQGFTTSNPFSEAQKMAEALANAIIDEIITNAVASGTDTPSGDSHALVIT
jgi:hypothetical protein